MGAIAKTQAVEAVERVDHRVVLRGQPWSHYEILLAMRGDRSTPRMAYLDGEIELMCPSRGHEGIASLIGRLLEAWSTDHGIELMSYGSWTLKSAAVERGAEPDECYLVGPDQARDRPDVVIEVHWSHGGLDKLEIYRCLEIPEVWSWDSGSLSVYQLSNGRYEVREASAFFPGLDLAHLASFLDRPTITRAVREFRAALHRSPDAT